MIGHRSKGKQALRHGEEEADSRDVVRAGDYVSALQHASVDVLSVPSNSIV
jgi:hypothetical protein